MSVADVNATSTHRNCAFADNGLVQQLVGPQNDNLNLLEQRLGVALNLRGNAITIDGPADAVARAETVLRDLYTRAGRGAAVEPGDVDAAVRMSTANAAAGAPVIRTRKRHIAARTPNQATYLSVLQNHDLVFALGPAGTGKTYLAVAQAVAMKMSGDVDRIILSRPAVEAGERLGFLPGDMREKVDPYLRPLYDALYDMMPGDQVVRQLESGEIEVAPLAFMRGRTLANAFVILDEAQNTTPVQMKMFLTRLGENARMVVTGDLSQIDLPKGTVSGLDDALNVLRNVRGVGRIDFGPQDVVRHDLVTRIVSAYDARDRTGAAEPRT
ncbi:MAG: PhoH family protein [Rhodobacteraceae bacterium]|nr:PhoH family protein [Paracoccaceae bacterium]